MSPTYQMLESGMCAGLQKNHSAQAIPMPVPSATGDGTCQIVVNPVKIRPQPDTVYAAYICNMPDM